MTGWRRLQENRLNEFLQIAGQDPRIILQESQHRAHFGSPYHDQESLMAATKLQRIETTLMVVAVTCAFAMTVRVFMGDSPKPRPRVVVSEDVWTEIVSIASPIGARHAPLQLAVFTDLECPYCSTFANDVWPRLRAKYGQDLTLHVVHLPSQGHPFAYSAARALECARVQERFEEYFVAVEASKLSLHSETLVALGDSVGVPHPARFRACVMDSTPVPAIERGKAMAARLELRGTPSFVVNGTELIRGLPAYEQLDSLLELRHGK